MYAWSVYFKEVSAVRTAVAGLPLAAPSQDNTHGCQHCRCSKHYPGLPHTLIRTDIHTHSSHHATCQSYGVGTTEEATTNQRCQPLRREIHVLNSEYCTEILKNMMGIICWSLNAFHNLRRYILQNCIIDLSIFNTIPFLYSVEMKEITHKLKKIDNHVISNLKLIIN